MTQGNGGGLFPPETPPTANNPKAAAPKTAVAVVPKPTTGPDTYSFSPQNEDVVIAHQPAIAVYENTWGHVVIRQEGHYGPDEDNWITCAPENLQRLIEKLQSMLPTLERRQ